MPRLEPVYILPHNEPNLVQIRAHSQTGKGVGELGLDFFFFFLQDTVQCKLHFDPFNHGIFFSLAGLGLHYFVQAFFSSCDEQGLLLIVVHGLLIAVASLLVEQGAKGTQASEIVAQGLICPSAYSWKVDSLTPQPLLRMVF